jgi:hypothetical protein
MAFGFFLFDRQRGQALEQLRHPAGLAQKTRLGVFQIGGRGRGHKLGLRSADEGVEVAHEIRK